jgi:predicted metalloprotease
VKRWLSALLVLVALVALPGCGGDSEGESVAERVERVREQTREVRERAQERIERVRRDAERIRDDARQIGKELEAKVQAAFDDLERAVPRADEGTRPPSSDGRTETDEIDAFLTDVLQRVDAYWSQTFKAAGLEEPRVGYVWVPVGRTVRTACGAPADDTAAFYCPADDTIYVGRRIARGVLTGAISGFPGEAAQGRAVGDFGVAYIVAHEYAHNLQQEQGVFDERRRGASAMPFELQADCLAGTWGASAYRAGELQEGDVEEALSTALAVGDFEVGSEQHHGTPQQRRDAWLLGFESGEPSRCSVFVRA